jgi:hypothetical protein
MCVKNLVLVGVAAASSFGLAGCGKPAAAPPAANVAEAEHEGHSLGGWWCDEHGVPEADCALCNSKLVAGFKEKGDWCEHNRPESQCFTCHPEKEAEYAALFEAKAGKKPPKPTDNGK